MEISQKLYQKEDKKDEIVLSPKQKEQVISITLGIEEVDETIRNLALEDVINTLQNGHPLNRLIEKDENVEGYIAWEDFVKNEAYTGKNF